MGFSKPEYAIAEWILIGLRGEPHPLTQGNAATQRSALTVCRAPVTTGA